MSLLPGRMTISAFVQEQVGFEQMSSSSPSSPIFKTVVPLSAVFRRIKDDLQMPEPPLAPVTIEMLEQALDRLAGDTTHNPTVGAQEPDPGLEQEFEEHDADVEPTTPLVLADHENVATNDVSAEAGVEQFFAKPSVPAILVTPPAKQPRQLRPRRTYDMKNVRRSARLASKPAGTRGGILLLWNATFLDLQDIHIRRFSVSAHVTCKDSGLSFFLSVVYGPARDNLKMAFLRELRRCKPDEGQAWLLLGNFNLIYKAQDKNNGNLNRSHMRQFRATLNYCDRPKRDPLTKSEVYMEQWTTQTNYV